MEGNENGRKIIFLPMNLILPLLALLVNFVKLRKHFTFPNYVNKIKLRLRIKEKKIYQFKQLLL